MVFSHQTTFGLVVFRQLETYDYGLLVVKIWRPEPQQLVYLRQVDNKHAYFFGCVKLLARLVAANDLAEVEVNSTRRLRTFAVRVFHLCSDKPLAAVLR